VPLADNDKLRIGPEVLVFRSRSASDAPTKRVRRPRPPALPRRGSSAG
jgi:hypothetical protein